MPDFISEFTDQATAAAKGEHKGDGKFGVWGVCNSGHGVHGDSIGSRGVVGTSQQAQGVLGTSVTGEGVVGGSEKGKGVVGTTGGNEAGVKGECNGSGGFGVWGVSNSGHGVHGDSIGSRGVVGTSQQAQGVLGTSVTGEGVVGGSEKGDGVVGTGNRGVVGTSQNNAGLVGVSHSNNNAGVFAVNDNGGTGVIALSEKENGIGIFAKGNRIAARFEGDVEVTHGGDIRLENSDCAEDFDIADPHSAEPGTVMVVSEEGALRESRYAYDKRVAGVISGAGSYKPAIVLGKQQSASDRQPIALLGKVYCKVDAQYGTVEVGDLLTTSPTPGHAMRTEDPFKAFGAVIGKALRPLTGGQGLIPILIALQ
jgi:hypothetical protein